MFPSEFVPQVKYRHPQWNRNKANTKPWKGPKYYIWLSDNDLFKDPSGNVVWFSKDLLKLLYCNKWKIYSDEERLKDSKQGKI